MSCASLLIGFEYIKTKDWKTLPGIPGDYSVHRFIQGLSFKLHSPIEII